MWRPKAQIGLRSFLLVTTLVGVSIGIGVSQWRARIYHPVPITVKWHGKVRQNDPLDIPKVGVISDAETWNIVWAAWHGGEAPQVDFTRHSVLVVKGSGPNTIDVGFRPLARNGRGDAKGNFYQTLLGGPGFCYVFIQTPGDEIRTMNGRPVSRIACKPAKGDFNGRTRHNSL